MDFHPPASEPELRATARAFLAKHLDDEIRDEAHRTGTEHDWGFHKAMAAQRWLAATWPPDEGGLGWTNAEMLVLLDELNRAGAPIGGWNTAMMAAGTIRIVGSALQRTEVLPAVVGGDALICLGFSEPESGSDVAAASTKAVREGDGWRINGQKMFTTLAHEARWVFLLTRTGNSGPAHRGLTMFLVPMDTPGIEITAMRTLGGERTNITFYDNVWVEDSWRVGEVNSGWEILTTALTIERGSAMGGIPIFVGALDRLLDRSIANAMRASGGQRLIDDPFARRALASYATQREVARLLGHRSCSTSPHDTAASVHAAMAKLFSSETYVRAASELVDLLGPEGLLQHSEAEAPADGWIEHAHRQAAVTTIYGGTSEIMRSIVAEQGLGLPRSRPNR